MTTTYVQDGDVVDITAGSAYSSGDIVAQGALIGVAKGDIASGDVGAIQVSGVFTVTVPTATVVAVGDLMDWDASASNFGKGITPASGDVENAAIATGASANGVVTCDVMFTKAGTPA